MQAILRLAPTAARVLLGFTFTLSGLNGFLQFLPAPAPPPEAASFLGALAATGYMFPLIKGTEVAAGLLLLSGRFVPLALALLAPVLVNIVAFHAVLAPGLGLPLTLLALELFLAWAHRGAFRSMLRADARPDPMPSLAAPRLAVSP
jgi:uncharacterized membrane protein YphA (DoxX/SURF4 family)